MTHTIPYSRYYTSFTADGSTHTPSHVIKSGLVALNAHNIYTHRQFNNILLLLLLLFVGWD
jgi:hypothetical protein